MRTGRLYYTYTGTESAGASDGFPATILELKPTAAGFAALLDKTIFYPEGGGQSGDRGSINGVPLIDVKEEGGEIFHLVEPNADLKPGPALLVLDAARRRDFTVQHTGQHLLSGIILRLFSAPTVSMHLGEEYNTIDVTRNEFSEAELIAAEEAVFDAIEENNPVVIHLCPPEDIQAFPLRKHPPSGEEVIRVVEIQGYDFSPCCGTHCASTGAIGMLRILGAEKYKGMTRITFIAGRRVLFDSRRQRREADIVSRALKIPVNGISSGVLALNERLKDLEKNLVTLKNAEARREAEDLLKEAGSAGENAFVQRLYAGRSMEDTLLIGRTAQKHTDAMLFLASEPDKKFAALCSKKGVDIKALLEEPFNKYGGQGGGSGGFFQGRFPSLETLKQFLDETKAVFNAPEKKLP
ncbi:MAG: alanyl-tRNA editing protein [Spirochaetaceae bacterium]|jgi:alanyl-tRNA synthetase|nr:alanyl-tRNA editing protein [Spirochaetaceae bacterium]